MKSRIVTAKPLVLSYNLADEKHSALEALCATENVKYRIVSPSQANEQIGFLCLCDLSGELLQKPDLSGVHRLKSGV